MIYGIVGHSASGKSTIERMLESKQNNLDITRIVSYTTRPPREHEENGVDYHFVTQEKFDELYEKDFFAETAKYRDWSYGLSLVGIDYKTKDYVVVVTPSGYEELHELVGSEWIRSIFISVPERIRLVRLAERGDDIDEVIRRIKADREDFAEFEPYANFIIENNRDIDTAYYKALIIIQSLNR